MNTSVSGLYIGGSWVASDNDERLIVIDPTSEESIGSTPEASTKDVLRAIEAARTAFDEGPWSRTKPAHRAAKLLAMAEVMQRRKAELVELAIHEAGAVRALAETGQTQSAIDFVIDIAERVLPAFQFLEPLLPTFAGGVGQGVMVSEPAGVAALITPFNYPFVTGAQKLATALAAGCTMVLKPSPYTPLASFLLAEIVEEIDLPPGVVNVVTGGVEAGEELTSNRLVDIVSFTGSDAVGRKVMAQASASLKKVVLELGGKSANIVFADADLDRVVPSVVAGMTSHSGQGCSLLTRTLVQRRVHDELVERVVAELDKIRVGDPADPAVDMGPLIRARQRDRVEAMIRDGVDEGARIAYGGARPAKLERGFFLEPTLLVNVDNRSSAAQREFFGPVGAVVGFDDDDDAVRLANDSDFGLSGAVWSADSVHAWNIAEHLRTGFVKVNGGGVNPDMAYGGYKASGVGREMGRHGVAEFLETKSITWPAAR